MTRVFHRLRAMGVDIDPSVYTTEQARDAVLAKLARAGQQGLQVFDMRGDDELIAPALEQIQHLTPRDLDARRLRWQYFFDAIWQQPAVYRCHYAIPLGSRRPVRRPALSEAGIA